MDGVWPKIKKRSKYIQKEKLCSAVRKGIKVTRFLRFYNFQFTCLYVQQNLIISWEGVVLIYRKVFETQRTVEALGTLIFKVQEGGATLL